MTDPEIAAMLEEFARDVERLPGVSRTRPHAFVEAKSDLTHKMRVRAKELRTVLAARAPLPVMRPGVVQVAPFGAGLRRRDVVVEVRRRRA